MLGPEMQCCLLATEVLCTLFVAQENFQRNSTPIAEEHCATGLSSKKILISCPSLTCVSSSLKHAVSKGIKSSRVVSKKPALTGDCFSHIPQADGSEGGDGGSIVPPVLSEDHICNHLRNLNIHKSIDPDEKHPNQSPEGIHSCSHQTTLDDI